MTERQELPGAAWGTRRRIGLAAGPLLFILLLILPPPPGLAAEGWRAAAVGVLMATWWVTEAIPIPATALLPLALFPVLGVGSMDQAAAPFANPLIFLFLGGFLLALAVERWDLHRRIALSVIARVGTRPRRLVAGFMASAALLSMWVSNTATTLMLLPIGVSVVEWLREDDQEDVGSAEPGAAVRARGFATALMLGIAYASSIGGMGTLIGTPPNALVAGFLSETYGIEIGFARWMLIGVPVVAVGVPAAYAILVRLHPMEAHSAAGGRIETEIAALGRMSRAERRVAIVFGLTAVAWVTRPIVERWIPGLSDAGIAIAGALILFLLPAGDSRGVFLLDWSTARQVPWGILLLFGGGLSLASGIERTGLAEWLGTSMEALAGWPLVLLLAAVAAVILLVTELASNTATAASFLPIGGALAVALGHDPVLLAVPIGLAASAAFMLPVSTAPNAIAYGTGAVRMGEMVRAGIWLDVAFLFLVTAVGWVLVPLVFG